ncbi:lipoprotein-releasing system ATP-binding protein LolD [Pradoshia eiseniae]|uniref:Lipoprotein-releasing system ATP-binding protein LolD n=1 Tax=Pradoshia eiseniae TaxID=2064768 RepID=A0A2S7N556_9BACI|nr:ABC transporter ATP-binding protein [Pradoshia eiseniae]PQD97164.1 lipoprotein-releasing system ATP-binding protein LolD [Pradoshia eiseniae]
MGLSISVQSITKEFKGDGFKTLALDHVSADFQEGEFISIVGTSGSGKSTLLSIIGTLDSPTDGKLLFNGKDAQHLSPKQLSDFRFEHIGFIFQQFHLLPTLTALENVMSPLFARKVPYNKKQRAEEVLTKVGLIDKSSSLPSQLSGGQQQRVAIARALIHEPNWLLADEPTGNLDTENSEIIFDLLSSLNEEKGCGVIFVTHDPVLAQKTGRMIKMKDGRILTDWKDDTL